MQGRVQFGIALHALHDRIDHLIETFVVEPVATEFLYQDGFEKKPEGLSPSLWVVGRQGANTQCHQLPDLRFVVSGIDLWLVIGRRGTFLFGVCRSHLMRIGVLSRGRAIPALGLELCCELGTDQRSQLIGRIDHEACAGREGRAEASMRPALLLIVGQQHMVVQGVRGSFGERRRTRHQCADA